MTTGGIEDLSLPERRRELLAQLLRNKASQSLATVLASTAQHGLWFMQEVDPATYAYHLPFCVRIHSPVNSAYVKAALQQLVDRHAALRATFPSSGQQVEMLVRGAGEAEFIHIDASGWSEDELQRRTAISFRQPFDLQKGPLVRLHLFSRSETHHIFLLVLHHIICDGSSLDLLLSEFMECYQARSEERPAHLPSPLLDFPDIVTQHRELLAGPAGEQSRAYWLKRLSGDLPVLDLPGRRLGQETGNASSAEHYFEIDESLYRQLMELARSCGVTLFGTLLAAYQTFLMRISGQIDIIVGVPMTGRTQPDYEGVIGHFVNLVGIRGDLSEDPSFREFMGQTWLNLQGAVEHQDFPFLELVKLLRVPGRSERIPLFRTTLNILKPAPDHPLSCYLWPSEETMPWGPFKISRFPLEAAEEPYDLAVQVIETRRRLLVKLKYDSNLFDSETIGQLAGCFLEVLKSAVAEPDRRLSKIALLSTAERERLLVTWNVTSADYPRDTGLHQLFAEQVARTPDATALVFEDTKLSYRDLDLRANQLAHYLRRQGVGREDLVAVCAKRSPELVIALLGVLKAGAAYVPLDPHYPAPRIRLMLEDSGARLVLTTSSSEDFAGALSETPRFCLDRDSSRLAEFPKDELSIVTQPSDLAYVIYTSGSTGRPKGVQIPHRAVVNVLMSLRREPGLSSGDVLLAVTSVSFDIAAVELFLPLIVGGCVWIASQSVSSDGLALTNLLAASDASVMQATPATWRMLIDSGWQGSPGFKAWCGGEALPRDLANQLLDRCPLLWNLYGPTETAIWSAVSQVKREHGPVPIGRPIANTELYVLDPNNQPVPINVPGELYIGGDGLAKGYFKREELTASSFIAPPISEARSSRLYKTGDIVRYSSDGNLIFLRRNDNQIKLRGHRIELGDVESTLAEHPSVREAIAMVREDQPGDPRLVAYLLAVQGPQPEPNTLRAFLKERLPVQMVPATFVILDSFPLTANGKIDHKSLPAPDYKGTKLNAASPDGEWDLIANHLARIWEEVLGVPQVGLYDDFFELGGHSLLAIRLISTIGASFNVRLPLAVLFEAPTIARMAELLRRGSLGKFMSSLVPIKPEGSGTPFFLVARFSALSFHSLAKHLDPEQPVYGLVPPGPDNRGTPIDSIEGLAAHYIQEMRSVQPLGPYMVSGYSFGGIVAYEVACQLERQGERVALLFIIDGDANALPRYRATLPKKTLWKYLVRHLGRGVTYHGKEIWRLSLPEQMRYVHDLTGRKQRALWRQIRKIDADKKLPQAYQIVEQANRIAFGAYLPKPYSGKLTHLRSTRGYTGFDLDQHGWAHLAASIEVHEILGDHLDIFAEPHVTRLAEVVGKSIGRAGLTPKPRRLPSDSSPVKQWGG